MDVTRGRGRAVIAVGGTFLAVLAGTAAPGCARSPAAARTQGTTYCITTTVGMVTDIVQHVAGGYATVTGLIGPGIDPHLYKPTRYDVVQLMGADVVFYSGLMLEGKMGAVLAGVARGGKPVHAVTGLLEAEYLLSPEGAGGHYDPHVWMDVRAWSRGVEVVAEALAAYDPPHASEYCANAAAYQARLLDLDEYVRRVIASVPQTQRVLVTAHDAFGYFGRGYGLEVVGVQGFSTESEAGLDDLNRLVDLIVERRVRAVFVETSVADRNVRALLEGTRARGWEIAIGGELYSDAMGAPGTYEGTYIGMIDHNATTIARALGGEAPARGRLGQLQARHTGHD
ncbi:MAG TPA: zinc ABC transporter substrate-binding protein [Phycisphaerae bacterium]|nr:zinc ABC transporter substrate-binding protein [Phycisphaerae bacterium]HNU43960.1 zinc ABC transporter substrate-binding protein [Phycisphaerae bacterium]